MQRIRRAAAVMVAAIMCCFVAAAARAEGVLDQVPSDALVVIKINHLDQTNQKIAKWAEAMGLAQLRPEAANPLGALEEHLGVKEGIDRKGDAAIVILDPTKGRGNAGAKGGARPGARARPKAADDANDAAEAEGENGGGKGEDSVLILVPTSNFKAFASGLPNAKTEGAVTRFHPEEGDENKPGYAAGWGGYAAISPSKALLQNKPQGGLKVTGLAARELKEKDIVVYANLPAIKASLLPKLQQFRQQMKQMQAGGGLGGAPAPGVENEDAGNAPPPPPARPTPRRNPPARRPGARADGAADVVEVLQQGGARQRQAPGRRPPAQPAEADDNKGDDNNGNDAAQPAQNRGGARRPGARGGAAPGPDESMAMMQAMGGMVDQYLAFAERLLTDGQAATFSLNLSDEGLNTTALAEFTPNSELGKAVQGLANTDQNLLAGLPDRKYFAFGGFMVSKGMSQLINDMMQPMVQAQGANKAQGNAQGDAKALLDGMKQIMDNTKSMAIGYTTPTGALGADSLVQAITVVKGNAKAVAEGERKVLQNMGTWLQAMPQAPGGPQMSFEMLPDTKTAGGVKFEQFRFNMELGNAQNNPQAAQMQQAMSIIYGPNGLTGSMGVVNDNTLLIVQGGTDKLLADAVAGAKAGQDVLSKRAAAVKGEMPKQRIGEFYVALDQIIITGMKYAQGMGVQVKMQLPPNLPPIGISAASEGTAIRVDGHVPTSTVQSVVAGVTQVIMQMQGGGAGAPDGL